MEGRGLMRQSPEVVMLSLHYQTARRPLISDVSDVSCRAAHLCEEWHQDLTVSRLEILFENIRLTRVYAP